MTYFVFTLQNLTVQVLAILYSERRHNSSTLHIELAFNYPYKSNLKNNHSNE